MKISSTEYWKGNNLLVGFDDNTAKKFEELLTF